MEIKWCYPNSLMQNTKNQVYLKLNKDSYEIRIMRMVNYSFKIVFHQDTLEVWLTVGRFNEMKKILSDKDKVFHGIMLERSKRRCWTRH